MYSLILKQFIRSRAVIIALVLILGIGVTAIVTGRQFLVDEQDAIAQVTARQQQHIQRNVTYHHDNIGLLLYYIRFAVINAPGNLAAMSIGQRDINPSVQSVTIRNLEAQKYDTDLNNPANLLAGNLDMGFVIIYLFPLLIIAFTFNLYSEETESGTWRMVGVQSPSTGRFLLKKIAIRAAVIYAVMGVLLLASVVVLQLPLNVVLLAWAVLSVLYLLFWFAFCFWIVSLRKSSSANALLLLSAWVVLAILLPAAANNYVTNQYPVPESLSTLIKQRDGYHRKWDVDKKATMDKFYSHYPQFRQYGVPQEEFSYTWYYAMQQMGDDESRTESNAMRHKILQREAASRTLAMGIPTMHAQLLFNDLAGTGLRNHLRFLDHTDRFHEKMRLYFYPKIFSNSPVKEVDWNSFKPVHIPQQQNVPWVSMVLPMLLVTGVLCLLAFAKLRQAGAA